MQIGNQNYFGTRYFHDFPIWQMMMAMLQWNGQQRTKDVKNLLYRRILMTLTHKNCKVKVMQTFGVLQWRSCLCMHIVVIPTADVLSSLLLYCLIHVELCCKTSLVHWALAEMRTWMIFSPMRAPGLREQTGSISGPDVVKGE